MATVPKLPYTTSRQEKSKTTDATRKFSSTTSSPSPEPAPRRNLQREQLQDRRQDLSQRDDDRSTDPVEANKILTEHIQILQRDCNLMSDILHRVDHRLRTIEKKNQPLLEMVSDVTVNSPTRKPTSTNALLCRLEAVDAYISSLQDIIDTQQSKIQHFDDRLSRQVTNQVESHYKQPDSSLSFKKLQDQYVRKIELIAKLQDENEDKDVQIISLRKQVEDLQTATNDRTRRIVFPSFK